MKAHDKTMPARTKTPTPRAFTPAEARVLFLENIERIVQHWANDKRTKTALDKCDGVAYSILTLIDGDHGSFPAMDLRMSPNPTDKDDCIKHGENWYEPGQIINNCALHEEYRQQGKVQPSTKRRTRHSQDMFTDLAHKLAS